MSAETVAFAELVRAAAQYTRLWCQTCNCEQAHQQYTVRVRPIGAQSSATDYATNAAYWRCVRCGNVLIWTMG